MSVCIERSSLIHWKKALGDFQKVVGTKLAARAIQVDRRLSLAYQLEIVAKIPLVR